MELRIRSIFFQTCKKKKYNSHEYLIYFSQSWEIFQRWINLEWNKKEVWCKGCNYDRIKKTWNSTVQAKRNLQSLCILSLKSGTELFTPNTTPPLPLRDLNLKPWTCSSETSRLNESKVGIKSGRSTLSVSQWNLNRD